MPRVKRAVSAHKKRRTVLNRAKGYYGAKSRSYRAAKEQVQHSLQYMYRDRRNKKREIRRLWITRINAAARIAAVLRELDVTAVITGIIERDAVEALQAADIEVVSNRAGSARDAAEAYLAHTLIGTDEWHNDEEVLGAIES